MFAAGFYLDFDVANFFFGMTKSCDDPAELPGTIILRSFQKLLSLNFLL